MKLPFTRKPTAAAQSAAHRFNAHTGWYAAEAKGNRVHIIIDPAKTNVLTERYVLGNEQT